METLYSYTNDQAVEDGCFADITPKSLRVQSWKWLVSCGVCEQKFSMAAFRDIFNLMIERHNKNEDVALVPHTMNGVTMWAMFEWDGDWKIFKVILPSEY